MALMPTKRMGPPPELAADAYDCIMVGTQRSYRIQVCGTKMRPIASSPRILRQTDTGTVQTPRYAKSLPQFIIAPRAQASRRCETQATLGGQAAKLCYRFGPLTPCARSANLIAGDGTKNGLSRSEQRTAKKPKMTT